MKKELSKKIKHIENEDWMGKKVDWSKSGRQQVNPLMWRQYMMDGGEVITSKELRRRVCGI